MNGLKRLFSEVIEITVLHLKKDSCRHNVPLTVIIVTRTAMAIGEIGKAGSFLMFYIRTLKAECMQCFSMQVVMNKCFF